MVRHPARRAQGGAQQAPPLTPAAARLLLSDAGQAAVTAAGGLDLAPAARIATAEAVRARFGPELGPLALEQAILRARATAKHPATWWTAEALEQATAWPVAQHSAARYAAAPRVVDLCCSVGGDLLALQEQAPVLGVDLDEARLLLARANGARDLVRADAATLPLSREAWVWADPGRRAGGRRTLRPEDYQPPLATLLGRDTVAVGVKAAPGVDHDALGPAWEVEVVSLAGGVKEALLWGGALRTGVRRTATVLPAGAQLSGPGTGCEAGPVGPWLLDPDGAVVRAGLVGELAALLGAWQVDPTIAYLCAEVPQPTPFGRWYAVTDTLPFGLKPLRERLRALDAGPLTVKKRGTAVEPETLRRQLRLTGSTPVTVVLTRVAGRQTVLIVQPGPSR